MENKIILGEPSWVWEKRIPQLIPIRQNQMIFWFNPDLKPFVSASKEWKLKEKDLFDAGERLTRFAPYIEEKFSETKSSHGIIDSPLREIPKFQKKIESLFNKKIIGKVLLKCDNELQIAGSVKARGGIYEVLKIAETLAIQSKLLHVDEDYKGDNYKIFSEKKFKNYFNHYKLIVGSTGNLGLSIGLMGSALGFQVIVHMSNDAEEWKKELLRSHDVKIVDHTADYSFAVNAGRKEASKDPKSFFIDDEQSRDLFLGYAVATLRLKDQLEDLDIKVDNDHPLFVYLPCGVGTSPGGITWGLKQVFQDNVHCFFTEPTHCPSMLLGMLTKKHNDVSVNDFGLDGKTAADGLACARPSKFVGKIMENSLGGIYTTHDSVLYAMQHALFSSEQIKIEPSAAGPLLGPINLIQAELWSHYLSDHHQTEKLKQATHICWATGGIMVPEK
ncbi:MAG: D-serine ammonia-lyase, partial [Promethearchaeota archaeon]